MNCAIFGYEDTKYLIPKVVPEVRAFLEYLIQHNFARHFFLVERDFFDYEIFFLLRELKQQYPQITYDFLFQYVPKEAWEFALMRPEETIVPGKALLSPWQDNTSIGERWAVSRSDFVVTYFHEENDIMKNARREGKEVVNISDYDLTNPADCDKLNTILQKVR